MSDRLFALRLFARTASKRSFSAAARELNIPQSTASRTIATLEREIGVALFVRTTRAVTLTDAGLEFLDRIESVLAELDEAEHAARGTGELRGILRIGLATTFAVREVIARLSDFMSRHPALRIDLMMGDEREDLVVEGVDVALRFGPLSTSSVSSRANETKVLLVISLHLVSPRSLFLMVLRTCAFVPMTGFFDSAM
jgi:DNA-binding transcriptional LysR family regulator